MSDWLLMIPLIPAIAAIAAAYAAYCTAKETKNYVLSNLIVNLADSYARDEMLEGMESIKDWYKQFRMKNNRIDKNKAIKVFKNHLEGVLLPEITEFANEVNKGRRRFSHHLHKIYTLYKKGTVDIDFVQKMVDKGMVSFLKDYIEPLQKVLPFYEEWKEMYTFYHNLYDS